MTTSKSNEREISMNKPILLILLAFVLSVQQSYADETKRRNIINLVIEHELGTNAIYEIKESIFKDTIRLKANDSINIPKALVAFNSLQHDFVDNCAEFVALFPAGTKVFNPEVLNDASLNNYQRLVKQMRKGLDEYRNLIESVNNYQPYQQRRLDELYEVKNGKGEILQFQASYFFDKEDNLERYFWLSSYDKKTVMGMINLAGMRNFEFIETILEQVGIEFSRNLITYIISDEDTKLPDEEVKRLQSERKLQIKRQTIRQSQNVQSTASNGSNTGQTLQANVDVNNQNSNSHYVYSNHDVYIVKKDICGATYSKDAMKKFTEYSVKGKTSDINYMIATGELVILRKGQKVVMVEPGFILSRVMLQDGKTVFTDTENITKQ